MRSIDIGNKISRTPIVDWLAARVNWLHIFSVVMAFVSSINTAAEAEVTAKQLFTQHCEECHSGVNSKGAFAIASLTDDFSDKQNREQWLTVLAQLKEGNMPPRDQPRPPVEDVQRVMDWIRTQAEKAEIARRETEGRVVMRRLNRAEYANTVRDLLGVEVDLGDLLPLDTSTNGFDNNAELLHTSSSPGRRRVTKRSSAICSRRAFRPSASKSSRSNRWLTPNASSATSPVALFAATSAVTTLSRSSHA